MKKTLFMLILLVAFGVMGCNRQSEADKAGQSETSENELLSVDMVLISHGQLFFYNQATKKLTPYEAETDSVVNVVFDKNNHLFYTVSNQQDLKLMMLDLSDAELVPEFCADWQLELDQITDYMYGTGAGRLIMDVGQENLYILNNYMFDEDEIEVETYNIASGETGVMTFSDYYENTVVDEDLDRSRFYCEFDKFYHVTEEGKVDLVDKIDFSDFFDAWDLGDLYFYLMNLSPDGQEAVFEANIEIGEGWGYYCVSTCDGKQQKVLEDSDTWTLCPKWLSDGSLVYVGQEPRPEDDPAYEEEWNNTRHCIKIIAPDETVSLLLSDAEDFYINPLVAPFKPTIDKQPELAAADTVLIDNGKVTFYDSKNDVYIPLVAEKDYVVNGVLLDEDAFYYTVSIGDELYLKRIYLGYYSGSIPDLVTDWDLKWSDCVSNDTSRIAEMYYYSYEYKVGIEFNYNDDTGEFMDERYYDTYSLTKVDI